MSVPLLSQQRCWTSPCPKKPCELEFIPAPLALPQTGLFTTPCTESDHRAFPRQECAVSWEPEDGEGLLAARIYPQPSSQLLPEGFGVVAQSLSRAAPRVTMLSSHLALLPGKCLLLPIFFIRAHLAGKDCELLKAENGGFSVPGEMELWRVLQHLPGCSACAWWDTEEDPKAVPPVPGQDIPGAPCAR